jgi:hypothetical protein
MLLGQRDIRSQAKPTNLVEVNPIYALAHCLPVRHQVTDGVV